MTIRSFKEIFIESLENGKKLYTKDGFQGVSVDIENCSIMLDGHYPIPMDSITTKDELLHWVAHLLNKKWVTKEHLYWLICIISTHHEFNPYLTNRC